MRSARDGLLRATRGDPAGDALPIRGHGCGVELVGSEPLLHDFLGLRAGGHQREVAEQLDHRKSDGVEAEAELRGDLRDPQAAELGEHEDLPSTLAQAVEELTEHGAGGDRIGDPRRVGGDLVAPAVGDPQGEHT